MFRTQEFIQLQQAIRIVIANYVDMLKQSEDPYRPEDLRLAKQLLRRMRRFFDYKGKQFEPESGITKVFIRTVLNQRVELAGYETTQHPASIEMKMLSANLLIGIQALVEEFYANAKENAEKVAVKFNLDDVLDSEEFEAFHCSFAYGIITSDVLKYEHTSKDQASGKDITHCQYYTSASIRDWLQKNNTDPVTRHPLTLEKLVRCTSKYREALIEKLKIELKKLEATDVEIEILVAKLTSKFEPIKVPDQLVEKEAKDKRPAPPLSQLFVAAPLPAPAPQANAAAPQLRGPNQ